MKCPYCGNDHPNTFKSCPETGKILPNTMITPTGSTSGVKSKPINPTIICGGVSIFGGGFVVLGWLLPWLSLGSIANWAMSLLGIGTSFGRSLGSGVGSGLQISLGSIGIAFATLFSSDTTGVGLLFLGVAVILLLIVIFGIMNIKTGFNLVSIKYTNVENVSNNTASILAGIKNRSVYILVIMVGIFILLSMIPFMSAILSGGFYMTIIGSLITYLGAFFTKRSMQ